MIRKAAFLAAAALVTLGCASASTEPAGEPSAEDRAAEQAAWMEYMTPGEAHARMARHAGEWEAAGRMYEDPAAPPMEMKGRATLKMILGGRYELQEYHGDFMGMPFEGMSITGYDNAVGKYVSSWIDSMGTGVMHMEGTADADGVITLAGTMVDPMKKAACPVRMVMKDGGPDSFSFEMWGNDRATGEMRKMMEMAYTRKR